MNIVLPKLYKLYSCTNVGTKQTVHTFLYGFMYSFNNGCSKGLIRVQYAELQLKQPKLH